MRKRPELLEDEAFRRQRAKEGTAKADMWSAERLAKISAAELSCKHLREVLAQHDLDYQAAHADRTLRGDTHDAKVLAGMDAKIAAAKANEATPEAVQTPMQVDSSVITPAEAAVSAEAE
jgi:hypothetical protein